MSKREALEVEQPNPHVRLNARGEEINFGPSMTEVVDLREVPDLQTRVNMAIAAQLAGMRPDNPEDELNLTDEDAPDGGVTEAEADYQLAVLEARARRREKALAAQRKVAGPPQPAGGAGVEPPPKPQEGAK